VSDVVPGPESWPLASTPTLADVIPTHMQALILHRDQYGEPRDVLACESVPVPTLGPADASGVLVSILASGPNFNTNFAALGLPVPVFPRGDGSTLHIPGSDALGIVVDAGAAVTTVKVGQAVILDSWTGNSIRGYETHDGFNAQFALVDEQRAIPIPPAMQGNSPEQLAAMLLTYGTAYRAVVERLNLQPGQSMLVMGGGKGTSYAGAQIGKALGARVILIGSNPTLAAELIDRGVADAFVNRRELPDEVYGVIAEDENHADWMARTQPFRDAVFAANDGKPVDKVFEHTGGRNFPLLTSALADRGALAFFGATGQGLKGEYKETFFYGDRRLVLDARWVWMRQKQVMFRDAEPSEIFAEIGLLPGRRGVIWGTDQYSLAFAAAALERQADLAVIASLSGEADGIAAMAELGIGPDRIIDRDRFELEDDMPDPLLEDGTPNPAYNDVFQVTARSMGRAIWGIFGPRVSPDFIVERPDQSTLHYSTFLARDFDENDAMASSYVLCRGDIDLEVLGSHMYHDSQAREVLRLLAENRIVMEQEDLEVVQLDQLAEVQQKMLDGTMSKPKGVALVQADTPGRSIADYEAAFLGEAAQISDPAAGRFIDVRVLDGVALVTLDRPDALNALSEELLDQFGAVVTEVSTTGSFAGSAVTAMIVRGAGRAFVAGADIGVFIGKTAEALEKLANANMAVFTALENLPMPVVSLIDGFALGGGNELAMSTHYRVVTENAALGQPEVKLGLIPGYGGMQRLPRIVGPRIAAEMSVNGEAVNAHQAVGIGLAHEICASSTALARVFAVARDLRSGVMALQRPAWDATAAAQADELASLFADPTVQDLLQAKAPIGDDAADLVAARRYAAKIAFEALRQGYELDFGSGLANDARLFGEVVASPSGQCWSGKFLAKDPEQGSFLTQLTPSF
jgi:enoyl-CoA hydratase